MDRVEPLREYRDDLPGTGAVAGPLGRFVPGTLLSTLLGIVPVALTLVLDRSLAETTWATAWCIVIVSAGAAKRLDGSLAWLVAPLLRATDYAVVAVVGFRADAGAGAALFAWLAPVVLHHYDIVYRLRHQHRPPPAWLRAVTLGWQGRMALALVAAHADATIAVGYLYGGVVGAVVLAEIVIGWRAFFARERELAS